MCCDRTGTYYLKISTTLTFGLDPSQVQSTENSYIITTSCYEILIKKSQLETENTKCTSMSQ